MQKMPLAIICAMDEELSIILSKIERDSRTHVKPSMFTLGKYEGRQLLIVRSGIGPSAMEGAMRYCFEQYTPEFCLHVGYCGAADPKYQAGDLMIAETVVDSMTEERFSSVPWAVEKAVRLCEQEKLRFGKGSIATVKDVIESPHEKAFVGTRHDAAGIDMESSKFAGACVKDRTGFVVVRAVLDPLDCELPKMEGVLDEEGRLDKAALAGFIVKHPKDALKLPSIEANAILARKAIAKFVDAWVRSL